MFANNRFHSFAAAQGERRAGSVMDARIRAIVDAIHASPSQAVIYLAGGASQVCRSLVLCFLVPLPAADSRQLQNSENGCFFDCCLQALGWLLSVPGASNTVLEALVPYSKTSMSQLLGKVTRRLLPYE